MVASFDLWPNQDAKIKTCGVFSEMAQVQRYTLCGIKWLLDSFTWENSHVHKPLENVVWHSLPISLELFSAHATRK